MHRHAPPRSEAELMSRASGLAGCTIRDVASRLGMTVPADQRGNKGWVGQLVEIWLGASASTRSEPDFREIGVELKTLPLRAPGVPSESTYICTLNLTAIIGMHWENSPVRRKLARVLWLPVEADRTLPLAHRRFGNPLLWSPDPDTEAILRTDYEEIMELVATGELDRLGSEQGVYLQIRPKAANARALAPSWSATGCPDTTLPRGFYLRTACTRLLFR